jgi:hypothetical protein
LPAAPLKQKPNHIHFVRLLVLGEKPIAQLYFYILQRQLEH